MSRVITFSRVFPAYHPKAGQPTGFIEKIFHSIYKDKPSMFFDAKLGNIWLDPHLTGEKHHTIRNGNRWKVGDKFSPRVWSGKPYNSKQIIIAPDIEIKKIWDVKVEKEVYYNENTGVKVITKISINGAHKTANYEPLAKNDGLSLDDLCHWFAKPMIGQIICWNENIEY
jgi:hypothetical protein